MNSLLQEKAGTAMIAPTSISLSLLFSACIFYQMILANRTVSPDYIT